MARPAYVFQVLRERGLGFFWTYFVESVWFDLRHGTKTFARVTKDDQTIDSDATQAGNGLLYVASFTSVTRKTVGHARDILGPARFADAQFFDLGCGKGKALMVYAEAFGAQTTHTAIGIEYDPDLVKLAQANLARVPKLARRIEVIADSALNLRDHVRSETLVIYLYNSFQGETLRAMLEILRDVPHVLIYVDPAEKDILPDYGYRVQFENRGRYNADTWLVASAGLGDG